MLEAEVKQPSEEKASTGIEQVLRELVTRALRDCSDISALALGDEQGLPMVDATRNRAPVMTLRRWQRCRIVQPRPHPRQ